MRRFPAPNTTAPTSASSALLLRGRLLRMIVVVGDFTLLSVGRATAAAVDASSTLAETSSDTESTRGRLVVSGDASSSAGSSPRFRLNFGLCNGLGEIDFIDLRNFNEMLDDSSSKGTVSVEDDSTKAG